MFLSYIDISVYQTMSPWTCSPVCASVSPTVKWNFTLYSSPGQPLSPSYNLSFLSLIPLSAASTPSRPADRFLFRSYPLLLEAFPWDLLSSSAGSGLQPSDTRSALCHDECPMARLDTRKH